MAIQKSIYKYQRLMLMNFTRATVGDPDSTYPDVDDRGYTGTEHGPITGVLEGRNIIVCLTRQNIEKTARLFITSSDTNVVTIADPAEGLLPNYTEMLITLHGVAGGNPRTAKVQVRYDSATGPVLNELSVWVFSTLELDITPHLVTIAKSGGGTAPIGSIANPSAIMNLVSAIWASCGVTFSVGAVRNENVTFANAGEVAWGEINSLLTTNHIPNTINVYFVHQIHSTGSTITLGYGFSRSKIASYSFTNPGIILADGGTGFARTLYMWGNDLAHEIGHFLRLEHTERHHSDNPRLDTWSRRMLMYPLGPMGTLGNWKDNVSYGNHNRGCLITMKDLSQLITDGECTISRATVTSSSGPY
jgi:hypothetical protein